MCCLFHNSTDSLKDRFLSHVELFTQTKFGKWNNRDTVIPRVFFFIKG